MLSQVENTLVQCECFVLFEFKTLLTLILVSRTSISNINQSCIHLYHVSNLCASSKMVLLDLHIVQLLLDTKRQSDLDLSDPLFEVV